MNETRYSPCLRLHADDNILVARVEVPEGAKVPVGDQAGPGNGSTAELAATDRIGLGHKMATVSIEVGEPIRKFGQVIGFATRAIQPGEWVHTHNVEAGALELDYAHATDVPEPPQPISGRTFPGYRRSNGRIGTRNYLGIVSTVNCSATASKYVARAFDEDLLADFTNIDGVVPLVHQGGCAMQYGGEDHQQLARTLAGFAKHPNIGGYLVLGLGCETGQGSFLTENHGLVQLQLPSTAGEPMPLVMNIQDEGGLRKTVDRAVGVLKEMLPEVNAVERTEIPVAELILGTECGGSDGNSGVTANPAVGIASDLLVAHGATSILGETPEIYGGEHLLTRRAISREVGEKLVGLIDWWKDYAGKFGAKIDNNPSVGNKLGGLTTIYEKSLGAIAKGGTTALKEVYRYADPVTARGFVVMDTPGYDPASITGMVAGGANVLIFTTGRGSCFGCKPVPTIKIASNTPMYERMIDDMDVNAGRILEGASVEEIGREIFEEIIAVAGGKQTKSEAQGIGEEEFCPWPIGPVL
ncbi:MAG: galactonate dehydratase [Planctomycetaceae bacterium]|jgi:altronate hydrolase|nr:galactonate dehydratase [Planctomycetaceae bacterium]MDP7275542.1 altronate dehydratase family protein [Planctomycetaceae bacterium]